MPFQFTGRELVIQTLFLAVATGLAFTSVSLQNRSRFPIYPINPSQLSEGYQSNQQAEFLGQVVDVPAEQYTPQTQVLGDTDPVDPRPDKRIEVDLSSQRLYAYEGNNLVYNFLISSGKWGRTPTGTFKIWTKLRYTKMEGGSKANRTYYYLPNVPYVMFFSNDQIAASRGFSIHGTYWHNNFGHPMSHGCINMKTEEVALLYDWAHPVIPAGKKSTPATKENPGTTVVIYGVAPQE